jgi:Cd2+/Zn2+-exporting ATPase
MTETCCCNNACETKKNDLIDKRTAALLAFSAVVFAAGFKVKGGNYLFVISFLLSGAGVLNKSFKNILKGKLFDENFLMSMATVGAFTIGEFAEGAAVMLFYQVGELLQDISVSRSEKAITALTQMRPDYATMQNGERVSPEKVSVGDIVTVKTGEKVALDGVIVKGSATVDTSPLTGEPMPKDLTEGDTVLSGFICQNGLLTVKVTKPYADSTAAKIFELTQQAASQKTQTERFITKFARIYTPAVTLAAVICAVLPPLIFSQDFSKWIYRALVFLVASCPCALVISIPLGFFGGIGRASKKGILIKGSNFLELLRKAENIVFDKTGTLTEGEFIVANIEERLPGLLEAAAHAEYYSNHPIAKSVLKAYKGEIDEAAISDYSEVAGMGVSVNLNGKKVTAGNDRFVAGAEKTKGSVVHVSIDGSYAGYIEIADKVKQGAKGAIDSLAGLGIKNIAIMTGDTKDSGQRVANELGVENAYFELLPDDKLRQLSEIRKRGITVFVGDGINDAPALAMADVGVAMGALGSDAAVEAADAVIMTDELSKIPESVKIARLTHKTVWQNIILSLGVKALIMMLAAYGGASIWYAVFADVGVALLAILNSTRLIFGK